MYAFEMYQRVLVAFREMTRPESCEPSFDGSRRDARPVPRRPAQQESAEGAPNLHQELLIRSAAESSAPAAACEWREADFEEAIRDHMAAESFEDLDDREAHEMLRKEEL